MVLVTGANGFIGKSVIAILAEHCDIIALDISPAFPVKRSNLTYVQCDILDLPRLEKVFAQYGITTVIHLASLLNSKSNQDPGLATKINILGSLHLLELSAKYKVGKFIYGSSISIYGPLDSDEYHPVSESIKTNPITIYGSAKRYIEILGNAFSKNHALDFIAIRMSSVIGPGATNTSSPWRSEIYDFNHPNAIQIPYHKNELIPLIYVNNVAYMIKAILLNGPVVHTVYNSPSETWRISDLEDLLKKKNPRFQFSYGNTEIKDIPRFVDGSLFLHDFSFHPVSVEDSLKS
jgi:nucleoside-diphosphate-sugar epimerase